MGLGNTIIKRLTKDHEIALQTANELQITLKHVHRILGPQVVVEAQRMLGAATEMTNGSRPLPGQAPKSTKDWIRAVMQNGEARKATEIKDAIKAAGRKRIAGLGYALKTLCDAGELHKEGTTSHMRYQWKERTKEQAHEPANGKIPLTAALRLVLTREPQKIDQLLAGLEQHPVVFRGKSLRQGVSNGLNFLKHQGVAKRSEHGWKMIN